MSRRLAPIHQCRGGTPRLPFLGRYCASVDEEEFAKGLKIVERQLGEKTIHYYLDARDALLKALAI